MRVKNQISILLILSLVTLSWAQNSPLSSGSWFKIEITESGLYKIDYNMLASMGFQGKDPNKIKVYGYGGIVEQSSAKFRYGDLTENQILFSGAEDGSVSNGDYILFYGEGPDVISPSSTTYLQHQKNLYARSSFYYVTYSETDGKRIQTETLSSGNTNEFSALPYLFFYENDEINILKSGREWFGESFKLKSIQNFNYNLSDVLTDSVVNYNIRYIGGSENYITYFKTSINGGPTLSTSLSITQKTYGDKAFVGTQFGSYIANSGNVSIKSEFDNKGDGGANGYLDYIRLVYFRKILGGKTVLYTIPDAFLGSKIKIENISSSTQVWDVSKVNQIKRLAISNDVVSMSDSTKKLLILNEGDVKTPSLIGQVENQNLHQLPVPELLIVTHPNFMESALAFKKFKEEEQGFETQLVTVNQIYNEYSSGRQDISAIRDFVKDLYDRDNKLHFLLLFGDCSYDPLDRITNNTNFVPVYESRFSMNNTTSFSSDDFYGLLEDSEGEWEENSNGKEDLDIGIGRLPIKSNNEGYVTLEKIKNYLYNGDSRGNWRNSVVFVADDGDYNLHTKSANELSQELQAKVPEMNMIKIYLDAYNQVSTSVGQLAPIVNEQLNLKIEKGALIVNFTGHGSEEQWTQENIFNIGEINNMRNKNKLPFFITATCEFGRYDDPSIESGAERLLLNDKGGAIALMTTTRPVYANSNQVINSSFYKNAFLRNADSSYDYLGDILRRTKNQSIIGFYNRNFSLIGDPSIKLAFPDYSVKVDSINGLQSSIVDTIKALQKVIIKGHLNDFKNTLDSNFNGKLTLTVYDKETEVITLGDDKSDPFEFYERSSVIFEGEVNVLNGYYQVEFVVPKDISYSFGKGKMSFYAVSDDGHDATGVFYDFYVGGGINGFNDNSAPIVKLYINDTTFISGGITGRNPIFLANIFDENGINTTNTGIGHEMTLVIDDDISRTLVLNDYHKSIGNSYKTGWVEYPLFDLSPGKHKLSFKVWDVNNNSTVQDIYIIVSDEGIVQVFPNPFKEEVTIYVEQPRREVGGEIELKIFNTFGLEVWSQIIEFDSFNSVVDSVTWNANSISGENNQSGLYILVTELRYEDNVSNILEKSKLILEK